MRKINYRKIALRLLITAAVIIMLAFAGFFAFRNMALQKIIAKVSEKMESRYNSSFTVKAASFKGFSRIEMQDISIVPKKADTLLDIKSIKTDVNISKLLIGELQLGTLEMEDGYIQFVKNSKGKNFDAFLKSSKTDSNTTTTDGKEQNIAKKAYRLLHRGLNLIPTDMALQNLTLRMDDMGRKVSINLTQLSLADKNLESSFVVKENDSTQAWKVKGMADPRNKQADLKFFNTDTSQIRLPYLKARYGLQSAFDSIHVNVQNIDMSGDELHVDGFAAIKNFMVNHPKIAKKDVVIKEARFDYHFLFGPDFIMLDSTSSARLNKIAVTPFARYDVAQDTIYELKANIPKMQAQDFITSLPEGLFTNFEGMVAEGSFTYNLDFKYNKNKPSELVFDSSLKKDGLKIIKYGAADLNKLNGTFTYRATENGQKLRPVIVGPENPYYTSYEQIPQYLVNAVLTSEDPSFFSHRGFINEAFKQSIIKNIKTKKFARGASTISMQLVKNVFLTREKTLSRKLEEILLVYILENNRIVSKQRMLEVYFNVIEWGPDVYGIGEASNYYFQKPPVLLSLDESIYLASIIPRPKGFMWRFNSKGMLKDYAVKHDEYIKKLMLRRGLITPEDTISQNGRVNITGPARGRLRLKQDTIQAIDSLQINEFLLNLTQKAF
ncbi:transglycosylase domain-containing protein [Flavobacterium sp. MK4S-17]|uniref:transglycosylase domain-containing protein n=1 Tax=Flavobacterium sp. MK4S-17 TaxID=2543737 RepID=UPI001359AAB7|nr:biosynthetic peptidoglycan transglycosylase [Flavobacterium sp. MK4S-17]